MSEPIFWKKKINKDNIISLPSAKFAQRVVKVKITQLCGIPNFWIIYCGNIMSRNKQRIYIKTLKVLIGVVVKNSTGL